MLVRGWEKFVPVFLFDCSAWLLHDKIRFTKHFFHLWTGQDEKVGPWLRESRLILTAEGVFTQPVAHSFVYEQVTIHRIFIVE